MEFRSFHTFHDRIPGLMGALISPFEVDVRTENGGTVSYW